MLNRIHHVGIAVRRADDALGFYHGVLGLPVLKDAIVEDQGVRGVLLGAGETEIELLEPLRADSPIARFLDSRGEGLHHLCFGTDDIEQELRDARGRGLPLIDERPRPGLAGLIAFLHPRATCGVLVEYAQPPEPPSAVHAVPPNACSVEYFDHLSVLVRDRETGVRAFADNFGLIEDTRADLPQEGMRIASLPIGGSFVEVVEPFPGAGPAGELLQRRGEGLYQLSFAVRDLNEAVRALQERSVALERLDDAGGGARWATLAPASTHGVRVQLVPRRA